MPRDLFPRIRTDEQLRELVFEVARKSPEPFRLLVQELAGQRATEAQARQLWGAFVAHRRTLAAQLGRSVHLRVAALDWLTQNQTEKSRAPVLLNSEAVENLWRAATTDALTGLHNRRHLVATLGHELNQRSRDALALAFIDLDGFKGVNDRLGHAAGDRALLDAARVLKKHARQGDVVARVGGDEFAVLFVGYGPPTPRGLADRLAEALRNELRELGAGCSVGFAKARGGDTPETLLARADSAMYGQKKGKARPRSAVPVGVVVLAATRPELALAVQRQCADRGIALVPTARPGDVEPLVALLKPGLVLVELLFPPSGGARLLQSLEKTDASATLALVMPQQGFAPGAWRESKWPVATAAESDNRLGRLLDRALPSRGAALPRLASTEAASGLLRAVHHLVTGRKLERDVVARLGTMPELDLLQRALGT